MRVIDGMHRLRAAQVSGAESIEVRFFEGTEENAFVLAVKLNVANGLPLSQSDRTAAAVRILGSHPQWSDRRIAAATGLVASTIAAMRKRSTGGIEQLNARVGRDGRARPLNSAEGRRRAGQVIADRPHASLREIADAAGVAPATAKDVRDRILQGRDPVPSRLREAEAQQAAASARAAEPEAAAARSGADRLDARALAEATAAGTALPNMRKDPSLRTEAGRTLLRLLSAHSIGEEEKWRRLVDSVPRHRADSVARAARACAEQWVRFAKELELRGT
ncbi:ParB/RepB/Spo0J family partition protein [Streptomyces sp. NPDC050617]|uniref:ParB/RepB/Spo0J family partition protein n=1 Tax=Streptomyces sp. NPDC050617 TaxID=3154628 RepID=UPI00341E6C52